MDFSVADSGIMFRIFVLVVFAISGSQGAPVESAPVNHSRIINGVNARLGEFPSQLSLQVYGKHACGASVLGSNWALTTATCVYAVSRDAIKLLAGTVNLVSGGTIHRAQKVIMHDGFNPIDSRVNDIALVVVANAFHIDFVTVYPINLPKQGDFTPPGAMVTVIGWGRTSEGGTFSDDLKKVDLVVTLQEMCQYVYGRLGYHIYETQMCADVPEGNKGSCGGDDGGPLIINDMVVGLVSWSYGCATPGYPTVYTRVAEFRNWINEKSGI